MDHNKETPQRRCLRYRKGEQIIKQDDYGISIYRILNGRVEIFRESEGLEVPLAALSTGDIMGEMTFLAGGAEVRSASARALEDSEVEVWHPEELAKEYREMPPILNLMTGQALKHLIRMNKLMERLAIKNYEEKEKLNSKRDSWESQRLHYRKKVDIVCTYCPLDRPKGTKLTLSGYIKDISLGGLALEVSPMNASVVSHEVGDLFMIDTVLPNGKSLNAPVSIVNIAKRFGKMRLGMSFHELSDYSEARKTLGFFLLPT